MRLVWELWMSWGQREGSGPTLGAGHKGTHFLSSILKWYETDSIWYAFYCHCAPAFPKCQR